MKTLDTRSATDDYMSTHSLTFSTPDLILKEFVKWQCEQALETKRTNSEDNALS